MMESLVAAFMRPDLGNMANEVDPFVWGLWQLSHDTGVGEVFWHPTEENALLVDQRHLPEALRRACNIQVAGVEQLESLMYTYRFRRVLPAQVNYHTLALPQQIRLHRGELVCYRNIYFTRDRADLLGKIYPRTSTMITFHDLELARLVATDTKAAADHSATTGAGGGTRNHKVSGSTSLASLEFLTNGATALKTRLDDGVPETNVPEATKPSSAAPAAETVKPVSTVPYEFNSRSTVAKQVTSRSRESEEVTHKSHDQREELGPRKSVKSLSESPPEAPRKKRRKAAEEASTFPVQGYYNKCPVVYIPHMLGADGLIPLEPKANFRHAHSSARAGRTSSAADQTSPNVYQTSARANQTSARANQTTTRAGNTQALAGHTSARGDLTSARGRRTCESCGLRKRVISGSQKNEAAADASDTFLTPQET